MKVGDYLITNDRLHIGKIYNINEFREPSMMYAIDFLNEDDFIFMGENDFKSSPNIIDLIEVGDIVKGKDNHLFEVYAIGNNCVYINDLEEFILAKDIKSVLTKEQFESREYKVGE